MDFLFKTQMIVSIFAESVSKYAEFKFLYKQCFKMSLNLVKERSAFAKERTTFLGEALHLNRENVSIIIEELEILMRMIKSIPMS